MRTTFRVPTVLALLLALTLPTLAQSAPAPALKAAAPAEAKVTPDPDKAFVLREQYVAKTAELEALLVAKPDDVAAMKKLVAEIAALRGALLEQTTLFRLRYAKETGTPVRMTRMLFADGMGGMGRMGHMGKAGSGCMGKEQGMQAGGMMLSMGQQNMPMHRNMAMDPAMPMNHGATMPMNHGATMPMAPGMATPAVPTGAAK